MMIFRCVFPEVQEILEWEKSSTYTPTYAHCIRIAKAWMNISEYKYGEFYVFDKNEWKLVKIIGKKI